MKTLLRRMGVSAAAVSLLMVSFLPIKGEGARPTGLPLPVPTGSTAAPADLLSNAAFVYGPLAQQFDLAGDLATRGSPLAPDADLIAGWCATTSINPQVILTLLDMDGEQVTRGWKTAMSRDARDAALGDWTTSLAERFYDYLYRYGERAPAGHAPDTAPSVELASGSRTFLTPQMSSATLALLDALAPSLTLAQFATLTDAADPRSFPATWARLFPESNPLDARVPITPDSLPPADLFQFPFPVGQKWWFNGAHNWHGSGATYGRPYSSMDFFTSASSCSAPPAGDWTVAVAAGTGSHPSGASCWYRIDHGGGWSTSYYHLKNTFPSGQMAANGRIGTIACETCVGGFADGPQVHFSLLYNGAYVDLEGVMLSGWTIHSGKGDYNTGSLERNGVQLKPYSGVLNEGAQGPATPVPSATPTPTDTPTPPAPLTAGFLFPKPQDTLRTCPVTLVADATVPAGGQLRFVLQQGTRRVEVGRDANAADGWQAQWDCQTHADGGAELSLTIVDASGREVLYGAGATAVTLSKNCNEGAYRTAFFANAALSGLPTASWCKVSEINYNWGTGSPGAGVPSGDYFSARFRGEWAFAEGRYGFKVQADDGVRVWVDRVLVLDEWHGHSLRTGVFSFTRSMSGGRHEIWLDYYEQTGAAGVSLSWSDVYEIAVQHPPLFLPLVIQKSNRGAGASAP